ncbi:LysE family translocator [Leisingera sp. McT4-56]|uniref:LysE family translocator n=1 Tax=Leisingera sp. McT4-56 TaxID=2881255 RepID=UPI001CF832E6|nr:LysE family translocator [Leisingera sp. McT4-56]MCB4456680.1 LysE family translocator [Leisingera sp. McT4-56]
MLQTTAALILFLFPLAYSPGPGNLFFAANAARFGFAATVPANAGYHLATWVVTAAIGFGFVTALDRAPQLFAVLKTAGSLYVLWLAWKLLRAEVLKGAQAPQPASFASGAALLVLNPKAYVIIALMFSQFLEPDAPGTAAPVLWITTVFTLNNLLAFTVWALAGGSLAKLFRTSGGARSLNVLFGVILAGVAVWMLLS